VAFKYQNPEAARPAFVDAASSTLGNPHVTGPHSSRHFAMLGEAALYAPLSLESRQQEITSALFKIFSVNLKLVARGLLVEAEHHCTHTCSSHGEPLSSPQELVLLGSVSCVHSKRCASNATVFTVVSLVEALMCHSVSHCGVLILEAVFLRGIMCSDYERHRYMYDCLWALLYQRHAPINDTRDFFYLVGSLCDIPTQCREEPDKRDEHWIDHLNKMLCLRSEWKTGFDKKLRRSSDHTEALQKSCQCGSAKWKSLDYSLSGPKGNLSVRECSLNPVYCCFRAVVNPLEEKQRRRREREKDMEEDEARMQHYMRYMTGSSAFERFRRGDFDV